MNLPKQLLKKNETDEERSGKAQKAELSKKNSQKPLKVKKTEASKKTAKKSEETGLGWWEHFRQYLREVSHELRKVVWPSRKETVGSTSVVLIIVILSGIFLGIVDLILSRLVRLIIE